MNLFEKVFFVKINKVQEPIRIDKCLNLPTNTKQPE